MMSIIYDETAVKWFCISQFANSYEIRKKKSDTICDRLGIPHKEILLPKRSERFGIKLRSRSDAIKNYHTNIGTHENKTEKERYYLDCVFRFGIDDFKRVEGFDLIEKYGMYSAPDNLDGVARDHMVSRHYGWVHNIPPEVIRHPANCRIIKQRENSSKGEECCITIDELYERIKNW